MLTQSASKLTGTPGVDGWSQVYEFIPQDLEKIGLRGSLFVVISTNHGEDGIDTITAGRELLTRFHEEYYGNTQAKPFNSLRDATQKVADEFRSIWGDVEIVSAAVVNKIVYSTAVGGGGVMILRNGILGKILESNDQQVISASGFPQIGDSILLATKAFFEKIPLGMIKAGLSAQTAKDSVEIFGPAVLGVQNSGNLGAIVIKFYDDLLVTPGEITDQKEDQTREMVKDKIKLPTIGELQNKIKSFFSNRPKRNIYIKTGSLEEVSSQSKKMTLTVGAILLILLIVSIGFGIRQKKINDLKSKYQGILGQAQEEVDQAISLASVSGEKSRELFASSEEKLKQIENLNVKDPEIKALRKKIEDSRAAILGEFKQTPEMFLDLTLLSSGFKGDSVCYSGGTVYVFDKTGQRVVSVNVSTKKSKVVAGPGVLNSAANIACYEGKVFASESDGVYEIDSSKSKVIDKTWSGEILISAFAGNMYILDKSGNQIYRYFGSSSGFGEKQNWLATSANANFSDVKQITIDGTIYVLYPNSKVLKYSQGSPQSFSVKSVFPEIGNIDAIYSNPDDQNIYLLDRAGKRVVVTDKNGVYKSQYADPQIETAAAIVASEGDGKIILLTGDKLYSIEITGS